MPQKKLIRRCIKKDIRAQQELYETYAPQMLSVCFRYARDQMEAEDILQEAFIRVFDNLHTYSFDGPVGAWIRRIMVNTAINYYHKHNKHFYNEELNGYNSPSEGEMPYDDSEYSADELILLIKTLPEGYRNIFNLYALDGYSHKEISSMLNISEGTSKSQLSRARKLLQERLKQLKKEKINETAR